MIIEWGVESSWKMCINKQTRRSENEWRETPNLCAKSITNIDPLDVTD